MKFLEITSTPLAQYMNQVIIQERSHFLRIEAYGNAGLENVRIIIRMIYLD